jgi:hypothetical protein
MSTSATRFTPVEAAVLAYAAGRGGPFAPVEAARHAQALASGQLAWAHEATCRLEDRGLIRRISWLPPRVEISEAGRAAAAAHLDSRAEEARPR